MCSERTSDNECRGKRGAYFKAHGHHFTSFLVIFQSLHARTRLTAPLTLHPVTSLTTSSPLWTARTPSSRLPTSGSMLERSSLPATSQHPCSSSLLARSCSRHPTVQSNAALTAGPPISWIFISTLPWPMVLSCCRSVARPAAAMIQKIKRLFCTSTPAQAGLTAPAGHPKSPGHRLLSKISGDLLLRTQTAEEKR